LACGLLYYAAGNFGCFIAEVSEAAVAVGIAGSGGVSYAGAVVTEFCGSKAVGFFVAVTADEL
jgi:hypothetical protein